MKRRTVFKHLAMATAAAWVLPSCISDPKKVSLALNRLQITGDEEALIGDIAAVLIPATDTPGAREVQAHLFTLVMVDDCLPKKDRDQYLNGMRNFDNALKKVTGKSFTGATAEQRLDMLTAFEGKMEAVDKDVKMFYSKTRGYIIQGYTSSQHFLTDVKPYKLVPGPNYNGCASVSPEQKTLS